MPAARISDVDLDQIAGGYAREVQDRLRAGPGGASVGLYIFISLSLPQQTLDRIFDQAARAQGVIVIRGLADGSMQKTLQRVKQLIGQRQVGVQIDPQAFERYAVTSVPSVVLTHQGDECGAASCPASGFVKATGDVSLDYVLERFAQIPKSAAEANRRLQTLRGHP
ncbi:type-F conjugative transfer system pilin assembly protein TrbC [Massilia arenosa]|uniref:Type-F conjugative transfer system pilin assembly protein TrbC n=1 Tax=Zemynaea arenosa TaxID=2561931 RepID=A0A4Y9RYS8_9BURK|nr:type-F conjugative transfer system pilin assembly protein TrbC [Massilia arenosa]